MKIGKLKVFSKELAIIECEFSECYDNLKKIVGGYIEAISFNGSFGTEIDELNNVIIVLDEEGKLKQKPVNIKLRYDYLVGDIAFIGTDGSDMIGLTDNQIKLIQKVINDRK